MNKGFRQINGATTEILELETVNHGMGIDANIIYWKGAQFLWVISCKIRIPTYKSPHSTWSFQWHILSKEVRSDKLLLGCVVVSQPPVHLISHLINIILSQVCAADLELNTVELNCHPHAKNTLRRSKNQKVVSLLCHYNFLTRVTTKNSFQIFKLSIWVSIAHPAYINHGKRT